jgi:hypothetical protein
VSDELLHEAERHREHDHARDEALEHAQRYLEVLATNVDPALQKVAAELIAIVGSPDGDVDVTAAWDRGHDQWVDEQTGVS